MRATTTDRSELKRRSTAAAVARRVGLWCAAALAVAMLTNFTPPASGAESAAPAHKTSAHVVKHRHGHSGRRRTRTRRHARTHLKTINAVRAVRPRRPIHAMRPVKTPTLTPMLVQNLRSSVAPAPLAAEQPQRPVWPVNAVSQPAHVNWDGSRLSVTATNASLSQVLHEVSAATGLHVEGLDSSHDQRIFGTFGPAPAKDVLNELLDGAGYNVMIVGDRGAGNPRDLLLAVQSPTARRGTAPAVNQPQVLSPEDAVEPEPEPEPEPAVDQRPPQGGPPPGARPAQQLLQELRNQQQQMQQQQQPAANPAVAPPN